MAKTNRGRLIVAQEAHPWRASRYSSAGSWWLCEPVLWLDEVVSEDGVEDGGGDQTCSWRDESGNSATMWQDASRCLVKESAASQGQNKHVSG